MKVAAVLLAVGAMAYWVSVGSAERRARLTAKASAQITSARLDSGDDTSSDETDLEFRFQVNGRVVDARDSLSGDRESDFPVGRTVTVCYDPKQPADADVIEGKDVKCGA